MGDDIEYGKNSKRIIFTDTDHRHAKLRERGKEITKDLGLSGDQVENIFDLISEEFPNL